MDREQVVEFAAHHRLDDPALGRGRLLHVDRLDGAAVADDRHPVGDPAHFTQLVRDQDASDPVVPHAGDQVEKVVGVFVIECRRRLVEDQ
ncbi:hypothetical protein SDC9_189727 [bioreactor metagenome]|uniref:Uncharacterized protein n=1 Tax=bioreactor metagenome TaxID=1076179 RepID=A0A645HT01_9ZZZZ